MTEPLLEVENLSIEYQLKGENRLHAVNDVSFSINEGDYFGLVGESGSGKSTVAKALIGGLDSNGEITSGQIKFRGKEIQNLSDAQLSKNYRWKEISIIPQASLNSLDPIMRLSEQAVELAKTHTNWSKQEALENFQELFEVVGLSESRIHDYPYQFSGGMQQRAVIALALFLNPSLIIADEPTTALDVIMQDKILEYIQNIRDEQEISVLMITHDIAVIYENCDSMAVLHGGQVAEMGNTTDVYDEPRHPYSYMLQRAFPDIRSPHKDLGIIEGDPPQLQQEVDFCTFADRCPWAVNECRQSAPPLEMVGESNQRSSCIRSSEMDELIEEDHVEL